MEVPARGVLNLNVPNVPLDEVRGVRGARLAPFAEEWRATAPPGEARLEFVGHDGEPHPTPTSRSCATGTRPSPS